MPPTVKPPLCATATFGPESVVRIAAAAASPPSAESSPAAARAPASTFLERQAGADDAGRENEHLLRLEPERAGETDSRGDGVLLALRPRRRIRDAGVDQHGLRLGEREMALRNGDRSRLDAVRRPQRGTDRSRNGAHDGDIRASRTA